jgi:hypothetical protein
MNKHAASTCGGYNNNAFNEQFKNCACVLLNVVPP